MKLFTESENCLKLLINVGCCYHLIEEEFTVNPFWNDVENALNMNESYGFPVSKYLKDKQFKLGRDARMCASQSPEKVFNSKDASFFFFNIIISLFFFFFYYNMKSKKKLHFIKCNFTDIKPNKTTIL